MSWVQVGPHKINTALICYVEQEDETVRLYFHGEWEGNPLDLHFDEAKAFWKHLKAEDVTMTRDKGSATVLPRARVAAVLPTTGLAGDPGDKPKPASNSPGHSSSHSSSHSHHAPKHPEPSKHAEHKRH